MANHTMKLTNPSFAQVIDEVKIFAVFPITLGIESDDVIRFQLYDEDIDKLQDSHVDVQVIYNGPTPELIVPESFEFIQFIKIDSSVSI